MRKSSSEFFSKSSYLACIRRYWAGGALLALAGSIFALAYRQAIDKTYDSIIYKSSLFANSTLIMLCGAFVAAAAVVCALLVFSYMQDKRAVVMLHSLPVRREAHFFSAFLGGLTLLFAPILLCGLELMLIQTAYSCFHPAFLGMFMLFMLLSALLAYTLTVFAGFLTGSGPSQFVITVLIVALPIFIELFFYEQCAAYLFGFNYRWDVPVNMQANPVMVAASAMSGVQGWYHIENSAAVFHVPGQAIGQIFIMLGYSALFFGASLLLYRRRKLEVAGDFIAVRGMKPVFRYGSAFLSAYLFGTIGSGIYDNSTGMQMLFALFGGALGFFIAEMLIRKKVLVFRHWKGAALFTGAYVVLMLVLIFDVTGYGSYVLPEGEVQSVYLGYSERRLSQAESQTGVLLPDAYLFTGDNMQKVLELQKQIATEGKDYRRYDGTAVAHNIYDFYLQAELKNGKTVSRQYHLFIPATATESWAKWNGVKAALNEAAKPNRLARMSAIKERADVASLYYDGKYVEGTEYMQQTNFTLTKSQIGELLDAMMLDNSTDPHWEARGFYTYSGEIALGELGNNIFNVSVHELAKNGDYLWLEDMQIFRTDQNAIAWLLNNGFLTQKVLDTIDLMDAA